MKNIRYDLHFLMLVLAAPLAWVVQFADLPFSLGQYLFFLSFGFIGALHATSLVVSLRRSKRIAIAIAFVLLTAVVSAAAPWVGLLSPRPAALVGDLSIWAAYLIASAFGASGYWLLVRWFWIRTLGPVDLMITATACVAATLLSTLLRIQLNQTGTPHGSDLLPTVAWWFAFSGSLYWSESRALSREPATR